MERRAFIGARFNEMPGLGAQKAVRAAVDLATAIQSPAIFEPMEIVAHHGRVIRTTFRRR